MRFDYNLDFNFDANDVKEIHFENGFYFVQFKTDVAQITKKMFEHLKENGCKVKYSTNSSNVILCPFCQANHYTGMPPTTTTDMQCSNCKSTFQVTKTIIENFYTEGIEE